MEEKKLDLMIRLLEEMVSSMKDSGDRLMSTKEVAERLGNRNTHGHEYDSYRYAPGYPVPHSQQDSQGFL